MTRRRTGRAEIFRKDLGSFVRAYEFLAQIYRLRRHRPGEALRLLHAPAAVARGGERAPADRPAAVELTHYRLDALKERRLDLGEEKKLAPLTEVGSSRARTGDRLPVGTDPETQPTVRGRTFGRRSFGICPPHQGPDAGKRNAGPAGRDEQ